MWLLSSCQIGRLTKKFYTSSVGTSTLVWVVRRSNPPIARRDANVDSVALNPKEQIGIISRTTSSRGCPFGQTMALTPEEERELQEQLARLLQEHRDLDTAIAALQDTPGSDLLQVQRLKKRKLYLRDRISFIEDQLTPDIIA